MTVHSKHRPPVPSSSRATDHGGGQTCSGAGGAKNLWVRTGRHWNLDLGTFNVRTLSKEGDLEVLLNELKEVKWDIIGLSEVRRTGEQFIKLNCGHIVCFKGLSDKRECGVGFLINESLAGNIEEFYSLSERVAGLILRVNKKYRINIVQVYAPTASYEDEVVESFYDDVDEALKKM